MDSCCVCLDCENQEHEGHTTLSVGETLLQKKQEEIRVPQQLRKQLKSYRTTKTQLRSAQSGRQEWQMCACLVRTAVNRMDHLTSYVQVVTDATQELCDLILSVFPCRRQGKTDVSVKVVLNPLCQPSSLPVPEMPEDFLKYTRSLIFDPDTTHHFLRITEVNRKLTNTSPWQHSYPDYPGRFQYCRQAMTSDSLYLGRHYIEAEVSCEGAHVGVTYKSIDRKGEQITSCITWNDFSWCMGRRGFFAWHAGVETPLDVTYITRIGIYVNFY